MRIQASLLIGFFLLIFGMCARAESQSHNKGFEGNNNKSIIAWVSIDTAYNNNTRELSKEEIKAQDKRVKKIADRLLKPYIRSGKVTQPKDGEAIFMNSVLVKATPKTLRKLQADPRVLAVIPLEATH